MVALELVVHRRERVAHPVGGADGPQRVILVQPRDPEDRHHRVPDELLDGAPVALDHGSHLVEVAAMTRRIASGSSRSPSAVEPVTSRTRS